MRKGAFGAYAEAKTRISMRFAQADQGLCFLLTKSVDTVEYIDIAKCFTRLRVLWLIMIFAVQVHPRDMTWLIKAKQSTMSERTPCLQLLDVKLKVTKYGKARHT